MCGSATFATEVSSTSMNVASMTVIAITQGLIWGGDIVCARWSASACVPMNPCFLLGEDRRVDVHAGRQERIFRQIVEHEFYRDALNHLHEVARCILGRQQAQPRARSACDRVHM